ncbi:hypothetical protein [Polaromonas sp.]|uniref:hypothetical protein n=1 Tax=Polaromonas sp. TaxID=1869339 RepID=UPI003262E711
MDFTQFCHSDEGKGERIKTDVRRGWPGCGPRAGIPGCHWFIGTSGTLPREERRAFEDRAAAHARAEVRRRGWWPATLPYWLDDDLAILAEKQALTHAARAQAAINSGATS